MGKTNGRLFPIYRQRAIDLGITEEDKVAAFGFTKQPEWLDNKCDLFDEQLGNWEINSMFPQGEDIYDAVVCTRVAYFAKDPLKLVGQLHKLLKPGGKLLIDWGLGDHWRYAEFKIGWNHHGMQEEAYGYRLYSAIWDKTLNSDPEVQAFLKYSQKFGYPEGTSMTDVLEIEVDRWRDVSEFLPMFSDYQITAHSFWPDAPQLYTILSATVV